MLQIFTGYEGHIIGNGELINQNIVLESLSLKDLNGYCAYTTVWLVAITGLAAFVVANLLALEFSHFLKASICSVQQKRWTIW